MTELSNIKREIKFFWGALTIHRPIEVRQVDRTNISIQDGNLSHTVFHKVTIYKDELIRYDNDQKYMSENWDTITKDEINKYKITPPKRRITQIIHAVTGFSSGYIYIAPKN